MKNRYKEILESLNEDTAPKQQNDRILIIDGLNTFIRSFAVNPSTNEDGIDQLELLYVLTAKVVVKGVEKYFQTIKEIVE